MKRTLLLLLLSLNIGFTAKAGDPVWKNYTSQSIVRAVYEIDDAMWIGTLGGIVKYDKITGEKEYFNKANAGIPSNTVEDIAVDDAGNIWIGTYDAGIAMREGDKWITYNTENSPLPSNAVLAVEADKNGNIWVGTHRGLAKISKSGWTIYTSTTAPHFKLDDVWSLAVDNNNGLWIGGDGLYHLQDTVWTDYSSEVAIYGIVGLSTNAANNVIATGSGGVFLFSNNKWNTIGTASHFQGLHSARYSITDKSNNIWVTTTSNLYKFDGTNWIEFSDNITLNAGALCVDGDGVLWSGGVSGLNNFKDEKWQNVTIISNSVSSYYIKNIAADKAGTVWFNGTNALSKHSSTGWENLTPENSLLPSKYVNRVRTEKAGVVWICTEKGIVKVENGSWTILNVSNSELSSDKVQDIAFDSKGNKWIIHENGISIVEGAKWKLVENPADFGEDEIFKIIAIDKNDVAWLGTIQGKIYRYANGTWTRYSLEDKNFAGGAIMDLKIDAKTNMVWAGTWGGGLNYFDGTAWKTQTTGENIIVSAVLPLNGEIWSGTSHPSNLFKTKNGDEIIAFNWKNSPLPKKEITALEQDENGNLWIGTSDGIVMYKTGESSSIPDVKNVDFGLGKLYPNPASANTTLAFTLGSASAVTVTVFDVTGRLVHTIAQQNYTPGNQQIEIPVKHFSRGTYMVKLQTGVSSGYYKLVVNP